MANPLSLDLPQRVVAAVEAGASRRQAAERFGVGTSSAIRSVAYSRATGDLEPRRRGGCRPSRIDEHAHLILDWIGAKPDLTLAEIAERPGDAVGYRPPPSAVHDFFNVS